MWTVEFHTPWGIDAFIARCPRLSNRAWTGQGRQSSPEGEINRDHPSKRREMAEVNAALPVYMQTWSPAPPPQGTFMWALHCKAGRPVGTSDMQASRPAEVGPNHGEAWICVGKVSAARPRDYLSPAGVAPKGCGGKPIQE